MPALDVALARKVTVRPTWSRPLLDPDQIMSASACWLAGPPIPWVTLPTTSKLRRAPISIPSPVLPQPLMVL
jgi:hypothetical protein